MSLLQARGLTKTYSGRDGRPVQALSAASLAIAAGEVLGVVGESGCGKSTLGRVLLRLAEPDSGEILFDGQPVTHLRGRALKPLRRQMQPIFQDPFGALNPRHRVGAILSEPLLTMGVGDRASRRARVAELIAMVGLPEGAEASFPHAFSGGQRQRIAIARALALAPRLIVADEPVSALDVSVQSQIINLIAELRRRFGLAILFISHDLSVIAHVADRVAVMYLGRIVETGPTAALIAAPRHPYTRALLAAAPRPGAARVRAPVIGEPPDPADPPDGCAFHPRCALAQDVCRSRRPELAGAGAQVACHLAS